jgi:fumarate reductase iron-sulfur subunit
MSEPTITLNVTRYRPGQDSAPRTQAFSIPFRKDWVVLDALNHIKDYIDGTLTYRWSCRMGVCGSCGMMVNGEPKLTCAAFLRDYYPQEIRVEPLAHFPVIRDLVIDMSDFLDKLKSVKPWIIRKTEKPVSQGEYLQTPA